MLDFMRKKTESWLTKVVFTIIILTFIFFFGYSQMRTGGPGTNVAAVVNGTEIPYGLFKLQLENTTEFYKNMFKGQIPENMREQIRGTAVNEIINSYLLLQLADKLGIKISDLEIYDAISKNPSFQIDGKFDAIKYKKDFLPYFQRRFGISYEKLLRNELTNMKLVNFLSNQVSITEEEAKLNFDQENTLWSFRRIVIPENLTEDIKDAQKPEELAQTLHDLLKEKKTNKINKLINKYKLEDKTLADINVSKKQLLISNIEDENLSDVFQDLFALNTDNSLTEKPLKIGTSWYIFTFKDIKKPSAGEWNKNKEQFTTSLTNQRKQEYVRMWQKYMQDSATIENFVSIAGN